ncbi:hypothetical protein RO3G_11622 [Lichtheimia corymbifera JMRC:FSU:9682]|uniref:Duf1690 domain-containing protein n=2 Tax=Lichtheimia TaxID=688353 RepID=A0A068RH39_9FUNG|nr:uncharacterized protein O0I10_006143 [Lichtheimia ornata]KAJ8658136.1 hypothetical protein O0I10_006143 [Lichtheimia ornata]CDH49005.1 hypothetical protein RO3G_11622 [Lichtheimia corymbifera JMRC:FSU:9682]
MGTTQSKTASEPIIFYNQSVPTQFSQGFIETLETRKKPTQESNTRSEDVEELVRQRVAEELKREKVNNDQAYSELAKSNLEKDYNSVAMGTDIENMIQRVQRSSRKELPAEIAERQEAVVACYKKHASRPLDCWEEVEQFKESVEKFQKKFVAAHQ